MLMYVQDAYNNISLYRGGPLYSTVYVENIMGNVKSELLPKEFQGKGR